MLLKFILSVSHSVGEDFQHMKKECLSFSPHIRSSGLHPLSGTSFSWLWVLPSNKLKKLGTKKGAITNGKEKTASHLKGRGKMSEKSDCSQDHSSNYRTSISYKYRNYTIVQLCRCTQKMRRNLKVMLPRNMLQHEVTAWASLFLQVFLVAVEIFLSKVSSSTAPARTGRLFHTEENP